MRTSCMSSIPSCLTAEGGSVSACVLATARSGCGQCDSAPILKVAVRVGAVIRHRSGVLPRRGGAQTERGRRIRRKKRTPEKPSCRPVVCYVRTRSETDDEPNGWRRAQPNRLVVQPPCDRVRQELRSIFRTAATRCTLAAGAQPCYFPLAVSRSRRTHPLTCTESDLCTGGARHRLLPRVGPNGRHAFSQHRRDEEGVPCGHAPARPQGLPDQGEVRVEW